MNGKRQVQPTEGPTASPYKPLGLRRVVKCARVSRGSHRRQTVETHALASVATSSSFKTAISQHLETRRVSEGL
jgi:hypothetical protein